MPYNDLPAGLFGGYSFGMFGELDPIERLEDAWPPVPVQRSADIASVTFTLEELQWLPSSVIEARQQKQLQRLLAFAAEQTEWYRERLPSDGDWSQVPILEREELQSHGPALLARCAPPLHGALHTVSSSGSTGTPISVTKTELTGLFHHAAVLRANRWAGRTLDRSVLALRAAPDTPPPESHWTLAFKTGSSNLRDVRTPVREQIDLIRTFRPDYLVTYPSNLRALCDALGSAAADLGLSQLSTLGETLDRSTRDLAESLFQTRVVDAYSAEEVGLIGAPCERNDLYHVQSEHLRVEVLGEDGQPVAPGEVGRVVVTTLQNFAMPLIRYAIGDYARVGPPCPCGRGLPTLERVMGRVRNMMRLPNGDTRWPDFGKGGYGKLRAAGPVRSTQLVQTALNRIVARLLVSRPATDAEERAMAAVIREELGAGLDVSFEYPDALERGPTGKFEDFRCEIPRE